MKTIAWFLILFKVMTYSNFMLRYNTYLFKKLYITFLVGVSTTKDLDKQIGLLCHECVHSIQRVRDGAKFELGYLFSSHYRASCEIEAYIVSMQIYHWYYGRHLYIKRLAAALADYGCNQADQNYALQRYEIARDAINSGGAVHPVTEIAMSWLTSRFAGS